MADVARHGCKCAWLVGGGEIGGAFLHVNLIHEAIISVLPLVLGEGIPLFPPSTPEQHFKPAEAEAKAFDSGLVPLRYAGTRKQITVAD